MLRSVGGQLSADHPVRKRLEAAPIAELSFEEIGKLMGANRTGSAARGLLQLEQRLSWIERFGQIAIHLGILGTVTALISSDPSDLDQFRSRLPLALGTTFWGLLGALLLSWIAGSTQSILSQARQRVREALLDAFEDASDPPPPVRAVADDAPAEPAIVEVESASVDAEPASAEADPVVAVVAVVAAEVAADADDEPEDAAADEDAASEENLEAH